MALRSSRRRFACSVIAGNVKLRRTLLRRANFATLSNHATSTCHGSQKEAENPPFWKRKWPVWVKRHGCCRGALREGSLLTRNGGIKAYKTDS